MTRVDKSRHDPAGPAQQYLWDAQVPGLGVQLLATGSKSWVYRYRLDGRSRRMSLGSVASMGLSIARKRAWELAT